MLKEIKYGVDAMVSTDGARLYVVIWATLEPLAIKTRGKIKKIKTRRKIAEI